MSKKHCCRRHWCCMIDLGLKRRPESTLQMPTVSVCLNRKEVLGLLLLYICLLVTFTLFFLLREFCCVGSSLWPGVITAANGGSGSVLTTPVAGEQRGRLKRLDTRRPDECCRRDAENERGRMYMIEVLRERGSVRCGRRGGERRTRRGGSPVSLVAVWWGFLRYY